MSKEGKKQVDCVPTAEEYAIALDAQETIPLLD
jgi:hypothetical protein